MAPLLAVLAAVLACAAAWELLGAAGRDAGGGEVSGRLSAALLGSPTGAALVAQLDLSRMIRQAGLGERLSPALLLALKLAGGAVAALAATVVAPAAPGRLAILVALGLPAAGFLAPDAALEREARRRRRRLVASLPDALDLLAVSTASGRGGAAGFAELARSGSGPLAAELGLTAAEVGCGVPQDQALASLRERAPGPELAALCAAIERSRRLGSPLAEQLQRQAVALRRDQRRLVEERAARAAPKIQLVVALVLVPSVLLMIAAGLIANSDRLLSGF